MSLAVPLQGPVSMNLPFAPTSAAVVRRSLVSWLEHQDAPASVVADATLVATELVANALRHADPLRNASLLVRWERAGDELVLSVHDGGGATAPVRVAAGPEAESGRGLAIVEALSLRWRVERSDRVHSVHVRMALVEPERAAEASRWDREACS